MKFSQLVMSAALGSAAAFVPAAQRPLRQAAFSSTIEEIESKVEERSIATETPSNSVVDGAVQLPTVAALESGMDVAMPMTSVPDKSRIQP